MSVRARAHDAGAACSRGRHGAARPQAPWSPARLQGRPPTQAAQAFPDLPSLYLLLHMPHPPDGACLTCVSISPAAPSRAGAQRTARKGPSRTLPTAPPSPRPSTPAPLANQPLPRRLSSPSTSSPIRASCADRPTTPPPRRPRTGIHQRPTATTTSPPRRQHTGSHHRQRQTATRTPERRAAATPSSRPPRPATLASRSAGATAGFFGATAATATAGWG